MKILKKNTPSNHASTYQNPIHITQKWKKKLPGQCMNKSNFNSIARKAMKAHNFMKKEKGIGGRDPMDWRINTCKWGMNGRRVWKSRGETLSVRVHIWERMEVGRSNIFLYIFPNSNAMQVGQKWFCHKSFIYSKKSCTKKILLCI